MTSKIRSYISKLFGKKEEELPLLDRLEDLIESDSEVKSEISAGEAGELALVSNVLGLKDLTAKDIMVPRADIVAAQADMSLDEFIDIFSLNNFTQIPVYRDTLDNVVGIVRVRDFLPYVRSPKSFNIDNLLKEAIYVVPSIQLLELLVEIRASVNHMALVVDEFGGIDGLVTLQDVVSEIVGEIQQNQGLFPRVITKQDGSLIADAKTPISECEELLQTELLKSLVKENDEEPDIETLGGLMMLIAGRMPTRGETLIHPSGIEFDITEADPRRVRRIHIRRPSSESRREA
ncbi:MAG: CBS domain-containing protein [Holosporaceae bacterium]|jgi:CBS domain containing-hemolysin-like protein|nr:CBS domain-containing protein [Holosporaceae bacterium]